MNQGAEDAATHLNAKVASVAAFNEISGMATAHFLR
jgi:hypothetical protein